MIACLRWAATQPTGKSWSSRHAACEAGHAAQLDVNEVLITSTLLQMLRTAGTEV